MLNRYIRTISCIVAAVCMAPPLNAAPLAIPVDLYVAANPNSPEAAVAAALGEVCNSLQASTGTPSAAQAELSSFCGVFTAPTNDATELKGALHDMSARSASAETSVGNYLPGGASMPNFSKRLAILRRAAQLTASARAPDEPIMLAALGSIAIDEEVVGESRFSGFANLTVNTYEQDETDYEAGFQGGGNGLVLGSDYKISNRMFAGAALNYNNQNMDIVDASGAKDNGTLAMKDIGLTFYSTFSFSDTLYFDGIFNYGKQNYELQRKLGFTLGGKAVNEDTLSKPGGSSLGLSLGSGWQTAWAANSLDVTGNLYYGKSSIDKFSETSSQSGGYNLAVEGQDIKTLRLNLGASLSRSLSTRAGVVLPQATLNMIHEFNTDGQKITGTFTADPSSGDTGHSFSYVSQARDSDYFTLALGVSLLSAGGVTSYLQYDTVLAMDNYTQRNISLGARMEF